MYLLQLGLIHSEKEVDETLLLNQARLAKGRRNSSVPLRHSPGLVSLFLNGSPVPIIFPYI